MKLIQATAFAILLSFAIFAEDTYVYVDPSVTNYYANGNMIVNGGTVYSTGNPQVTFKATTSIVFVAPFTVQQGATMRAFIDPAGIPEVRVDAYDSSAFEAAAPAGQDREGKFDIWRTGSTAEPLLVYFKLTGAVKDVNYTVSALGNPAYDAATQTWSVVIPAGSQNVIIVFTPLLDSTFVSEVLQLTLQPSPTGAGQFPKYLLPGLPYRSIVITDSTQGGGGGGSTISVSSQVTNGIAWEALTPPETYMSRIGSIQFVRSGNASTQVTVPLTIGGTATSTGATPDYSISSVPAGAYNSVTKSVTFGSNQTAVTLQITPNDDIDYTESLETVTFQITPSGSYFVATPEAKTVSISNNPIQSFVANPSPATTGNAVGFTYVLPGAPAGTVYYWNFGDGAPYPGGNQLTTTNYTNHVYSDARTYTVRAWTVQNNQRVVGTLTLTVNLGAGGRQVVAVNQHPTILSVPWATPNPVTLPNPTTLNVIAIDPDNAPEALKYTWSKVSGPGSVGIKPNGTTESRSANVTFDAAGTYVLKVAVSDGKDSTEGNVTVIVEPEAALEEPEADE